MNLKTQIKEFGKQTLKKVHNLSTKLLVSRFDHGFLHDDIPLSTDTYHTNFLIEHGNLQGKRILEVGSREVTGKSAARQNFANAEYVGFDFYTGNNVDVVGDAHKLSTYFDEKFDVIYSSAVFEHLAMPWIASFEIAKCLKVGGIVCITTHFSYSSHERPWHFFQFSDMALKVLFPPELGIECIESGVSNSIVGRFSSKVQDTELAYQNVTGLYCHSTFLGRKIKETPDDFDWKNLNLQDVVGDTLYPKP
jgi:SAM-dependent methyltransferase